MAKPEKKKAACKACAFKYKASVEEDDDEEDEDRAFFEEGSHLLRKLETDKTQLAPIQEELDPRHTVAQKTVPMFGHFAKIMLCNNIQLIC